MMNLIYLMDHILFQTFKISLNLSLKKNETLTENSAVQIYPNKIKRKTGCKLELLSSEMMKLSGSTKKHID